MSTGAKNFLFCKVTVGKPPVNSNAQEILRAVNTGWIDEESWTGTGTQEIGWEVDILVQMVATVVLIGRGSQEGKADCWVPPSCRPMPWSNSQNTCQGVFLWDKDPKWEFAESLGNIPRADMCKYEKQVWDIGTSAAQWGERGRLGLQDFGVYDGPQDHAQPYIRTGSFFMLPCWIWKHFQEQAPVNERKQRHPHAILIAYTLVYRIHTLYNIYTQYSHTTTQSTNTGHTK